MIKSSGKKIMINEGDFGINIPLNFKGDLQSTDIIKLKIKKTISSKDIIVEKEFTDLVIDEDSKTTCMLSFTQEESNKLKYGNYKYGIKQYRNDKLLNTIVSSENFEVVKGV